MSEKTKRVRRVKIPIEKYFQTTDTRLTRYEVAYVSARFRGIMKPAESWDDAIRKIIEEGDR